MRYLPIPPTIDRHGAQRLSERRRDGSVPSRPTKLKALAKRFMAFRAAQREDREPVDMFCRRGEITARFAYFD